MRTVLITITAAVLLTFGAVLPTATAAPATITDGIWLVGDDFPAGVYTARNITSGDCFWSIYKAGTNRRDILQNENVSGGHPTVVLKAGMEFKSARCGTWTTAPLAPRATRFTDGAWTVGRDIAPGTYRTAGTVRDCYWAIYTARTNTGDILANDNVSGGRPTMTLTKGQEVKSARCGLWTRR